MNRTKKILAATLVAFAALTAAGAALPSADHGSSSSAMGGGRW